MIAELVKEKSPGREMSRETSAVRGSCFESYLY
jgi:hypothetical protein